MLRLGVITLFPNLFDFLMSSGVVKRAFLEHLCSLEMIDLRSCSMHAHNQVDDRPYGGGPGMVLMPDVLEAAVREAKSKVGSLAKVIVLSPVGRPIRQDFFRNIAENQEPTIFVCGRYEGFDQRFIDAYADDCWSLGDFVLSGGELPALVCIDGILRLLPGVLSCPDSSLKESFSENTLDYPHYTRPKSFNGLEVPSVLLSGDHGKIEKWRREQSIKLTRKWRPDLHDGC